MSSVNDRFVKAVREAYRRTMTDGARSTSRIKVLHGWVQNEIRSLLGPDYEIRGLSDDPDSGEERVAGWYYPKNVDVSVKRDGAVLGVVSCKFINSNYKQNANNYFENQMGETANLRRNDIVFGNIFCVSEPIPYRSRKGDVNKIEHIRGSDIEKYSKLEYDHTHLHAPDIQALVVVQLDMEKDEITGICTRDDLSHLTDGEYEMLMGMNFDRFFRVFTNSITNKFDFLRDSRPAEKSAD